MTQQDAPAEPGHQTLLDCPFCGSTAELVCTSEDDNDRAPRPHSVFTVECTTCGARTSETSSCWHGEAGSDKADEKAHAKAMAKWNRREGAAQAG